MKKSLKKDWAKTRIIFFDLEFYVTPQHRLEHGFSYNPWHKHSKILGGAFYVANGTQTYLDQPKEQLEKKIQDLWLWNLSSQKELLEKIYDLLQQQLQYCLKIGQGTLPVLCGIGIQNADIAVLSALFRRYKILTEAEAFSFFNQFRIVDLAVLGISFFNHQHQFLYPKIKNELLNKFLSQDVHFESGTTVWQCYEEQQFEQIAKRTQNEVLYTLYMYDEINTQMRYLKKAEQRLKHAEKKAKLVL